MRNKKEIVYKTKEAKFLSEIINIFREDIKNPIFAALTSSLNSLVKAVDASESLRKVFIRIFNYVKENWNED